MYYKDKVDHAIANDVRFLSKMMKEVEQMSVKVEMDAAVYEMQNRTEIQFI